MERKVRRKLKIGRYIMAGDVRGLVYRDVDIHNAIEMCAPFYNLDVVYIQMTWDSVFGDCLRVFKDIRSPEEQNKNDQNDHR